MHGSYDKNVIHTEFSTINEHTSEEFRSRSKSTKDNRLRGKFRPSTVLVLIASSYE